MKIKFMHKPLCLLLALLFLTLPLSACATRKTPLMAELDFTAVDPTACSETDAITNYVKLSVADYGDIIIRLYPQVAPETVENFQKLVSEHFYDGLIFHRVIENFMIQTGDPEGTGYGSSKQKIKGEFSLNGFENNLKHIRGVVSMARGDELDSASSQFFIVQTTYPSLNGKYSSFGYVVSGMEVVDAIVSVATNAKDKPMTDVVLTSARFVTVSEP